VSREFKIFLWILLVLFLLFLTTGLGATPDALFSLLFGWITFLSEVVPKVRVNPAGVGLAVACLGLAAWLGHGFCSWLWKGSGHEDPWRLRWTLAGLSTLLLLFAAGMAFTGVAHQVGWLLRSPVRLTRGSMANERNAFASLKTIASAQADFRANDRDGNKIQDFWRGDIAGLYTLKPDGSSEAIKLLEVTLAGADAKPILPVEGLPASPKAGHWCRALRFKDEKELDPDRFAAVCYPDTPSAGIYMFLISHENTLYRKTFEPRVVPEHFPEDPLKEGWTKLD
jgi:hypothetical protein